MRFDKGWVKIDRGLFNGDIGDNVHCFAIWHALLSMATWKETKIIWDGKRRDLPPGSVVFGITELTRRWGCSKNTVSKWLKYLVVTERISLETCPRGCIATICNWSEYQTSDDEVRTPSEHNENTTRTPSEHSENLSKEYKKERKKNNTRQTDFDFDLVWEAYPRKVGKTEALDRFNRLIKTEQDFFDLRRAVDNYAAYVGRQDKDSEFIRHMTTFLGTENKQCWRDWIVAHAESQKPVVTAKTVINL